MTIYEKSEESSDKLYLYDKFSRGTIDGKCNIFYTKGALIVIEVDYKHIYLSLREAEEFIRCMNRAIEDVKKMDNKEE